MKIAMYIYTDALTIYLQIDPKTDGVSETEPERLLQLVSRFLQHIINS